MLDMTKLDTVRLCEGAGSSADALCVMQAVDYVTSGGTSDHPECASPIITAFMIRWNDNLPSDDDRARLLRPLIPDLINTRTTDADEMTRSWLAYDWLVRVQLVAWLRLTLALVPHAEAVAALPALASRAALDAAWPTISAARDASAAAGDAARDAAWDAAWAAASAAAWAAASAAARAAASAAARDAAWDAAWDAASAAAWAAASAAASAAARDAAWDAAWAAASAAARAAASAAAWAAASAAARDAAWDAASAAAGDAARDAAWDAAWDAARDAAWDACAETVAALQLSAQQLVRDMCAVGRVAAVAEVG